MAIRSQVSNQILTTSGTPTFASLTLTSPLTVANGGSGRATATAYALVASGTTSTGAQQSVGVGSAGQILQSGGASALPAYTTATYPGVATTAGAVLRADGTNWVKSTATFADTYSASTLLYSNGANTVTGLATANSAVLVTNSSGVPAWSSTMTNGQIIIGSTGGTPTAATLTAGSNITITNGAGSITIAASGGGSSFTWNTISGTTQAASVNNGYVVGNASQTTITLPATAAVGDVVSIRGKGAAGFILAANSGQTIKYLSATTTTAGSLTSAGQYDCVDVTCITANTTWVVNSSASLGLTVA